MTEVDDSAAIEAQEAALYGDGDVEKAQLLYLKSIGNVDPYGTEAEAPVIDVEVPDEAKTVAPVEPAGTESEIRFENALLPRPPQ